MYTLSKGKNIRYYHFLQPSQYLEGSKRLGDLERKVAIHPGSNFDQGVNHGYPLLLRTGKELMARDVKFIDLTMIFQNVSEPLYIDTSCHLNLTGKEILGKRIGEFIRVDITKRKPVPQSRK